MANPGRNWPRIEDHEDRRIEITFDFFSDWDPDAGELAGQLTWKTKIVGCKCQVAQKQNVCGRDPNTHKTSSASTNMDCATVYETNTVANGDLNNPYIEKYDVYFVSDPLEFNTNNTRIENQILHKGNMDLATYAIAQLDPPGNTESRMKLVINENTLIGGTIASGDAIKNQFDNKYYTHFRVIPTSKNWKFQLSTAGFPDREIPWYSPYENHPSGNYYGGLDAKLYYDDGTHTGGLLKGDAGTGSSNDRTYAMTKMGYYNFDDLQMYVDGITFFDFDKDQNEIGGDLQFLSLQRSYKSDDSTTPGDARVNLRSEEMLFEIHYEEMILNQTESKFYRRWVMLNDSLSENELLFSDVDYKRCFEGNLIKDSTNMSTNGLLNKIDNIPVSKPSDFLNSGYAGKKISQNQNYDSVLFKDSLEKSAIERYCTFGTVTEGAITYSSWKLFADETAATAGVYDQIAELTRRCRFKIYQYFIRENEIPYALVNKYGKGFLEDGLNTTVMNSVEIQHELDWLYGTGGFGSDLLVVNRSISIIPKSSNADGSVGYKKSTKDGPYSYQGDMVNITDKRNSPLDQADFIDLDLQKGTVGGFVEAGMDFDAEDLSLLQRLAFPAPDVGQAFVGPKSMSRFSNQLEDSSLIKSIDQTFQRMAYFSMGDCMANMTCLKSAPIANRLVAPPISPPSRSISSKQRTLFKFTT